MASKTLFTISDTTPATAVTAVGDTVGSLLPFDWFTVDAALVGATGGTLDVYLQRKIDTDLWADWLHFPQLSAGAAAVKYSAMSGSDKTIHVVGNTNDAGTGAPALAVNTFLGGHPGQFVRAVYVAGASTSAGAAVVIRITGWRGNE